MWMDGDSLAPPCGTEPFSLPYIISALDLTSSDVLYDLGCGDGRVCLAADEVGNVMKAVGVEIEDDVADAFEASIVSKGLQGRVQCVRGDLRDVDFREATAVVLYLLPEGIEAVQEKLIKMLREKKGMRVLCNTWGFKGVKETKRVDVEGLTLLVYENCGGGEETSLPA